MNGRVWTYCSGKELTDEMQTAIAADTKFFLENWKAHGTPLTASFEIRDRRFLIITVDEDSYAASGCSIDKQLQFIKQLEQKYGIELLNRLLVPFLNNENMVEVIQTSKVKEFFQTGKLNPETIIFNPAVSTTAELENNFKVPLKESWLRAKIS